MAASPALGGNVVIHSGEDEDTVMQVGPGAGNADGASGIRIESDPDNGSIIHAAPAPPRDPAPEAQPIIVVPEIRIKEK